MTEDARQARLDAMTAELLDRRSVDFHYFAAY
jgi:hypothetical protein